MWSWALVLFKLIIFIIPSPSSSSSYSSSSLSSHHCQCQWLWFCNMDMVMHGLYIGGEVTQAAGTDEAKVVVHGPQVIHHHSLILTLFATPGAEGQATSSSQGLYGMNALEAYDCWWLYGRDCLEKVDVFQRSHCHLVSSPEVLLVTLGLLHFIDLCVQEAGWCGHLAEDGGEVIWPLLFKVGPVGLLVYPSSYLYNVRLLGEGFLPEFLQGLSLLALPVRAFFWHFIIISCLLFILP